MLNKTGYALLLLIFGALLFLLGALLPQDLRQQLAPGGDAAAPAALAPTPPAVRSAPPQAAPAPPPPLESLLIPAPAPAAARYTLRLGLFTQEAEARELARRAEALHAPKLPLRVFSARDRAGQTWWLTLAGDAAQPQDLDAARAWLRERLALDQTPMLLAPPPAK